MKKILNGIKCKWNKILLFLSVKMEKCENKLCTCNE